MQSGSLHVILHLIDNLRPSGVLIGPFALLFTVVQDPTSLTSLKRIKRGAFAMWVDVPDKRLSLVQTSLSPA